MTVEDDVRPAPEGHGSRRPTSRASRTSEKFRSHPRWTIEGALGAFCMEKGPPPGDGGGGYARRADRVEPVRLPDDLDHEPAPSLADCRMVDTGHRRG